MSNPLSSINGATKTLQALLDIGKQTKNTEMMNLIADITIYITDLKTQIANLQAENLDLRKPTQKKNNVEIPRSHLREKDGLYYTKELLRNKAVGPYCGYCYDHDSKLILVEGLPHLNQFKCPNCKRFYNV